MDENKPQAEALAISGDRILRVGSNSEIEALRGPETEVMDLEGQFVMPGLSKGMAISPAWGKA
ncbi:MAG: hypothetical protein IPJ00_20985 [Saprospirales bacterium]|nr:hypothetical protein [Saprospirales bacterium]